MPFLVMISHSHGMPFLTIHDYKQSRPQSQADYTIRSQLTQLRDLRDRHEIWLYSDRNPTSTRISWVCGCLFNHREQGVLHWKLGDQIAWTSRASPPCHAWPWSTALTRTSQCCSASRTQRPSTTMAASTLDFSHFGPFKKLILQIDPWKNLSQKWSFLGRQSGWRRHPTGRRLWRRPPATVAHSNRRGRRRAPAMLASPPLFLFLCMELQRCHFYFIFSDVFSHSGSRYNQPQKKFKLELPLS